MKFFTPILRAAALAATLGLATVSAQAATVNYNFKVTIDTVTSPLVGQSFDGQFSFDDSTGVASLGSETLYALTAFSYTFDGVPYALADLDNGDAVFEGNTFNGIDVGALLFSFVPAVAGGSPFFAYDFGAGDSGNGSLSFTLVQQPVPEPGSALLALAALGLLGWRRGRAR
jgi:PEP-CTERM motif